MATKEAAVAVIVYGPDKTVLLVKDTDRPLPHFWKFPGGHVDPGETPLQAAVREIKEEAGVELNESTLRLLHTEQREHLDTRSSHMFYLFGTIVDSYRGLRDRGETGEFTKLCREDEFENLPDFHERHLELLYRIGWKPAAPSAA